MSRIITTVTLAGAAALCASTLGMGSAAASHLPQLCTFGGPNGLIVEAGTGNGGVSGDDHPTVPEIPGTLDVFATWPGTNPPEATVALDWRNVDTGQAGSARGIGAPGPGNRTAVYGLYGIKTGPGRMEVSVHVSDQTLHKPYYECSGFVTIR